MSQNDDAGVQREQISASAVYQQLDDHLAPDEAPYNVDSGLQRLLGWMGKEVPPDENRSPMEPAVSAPELDLTTVSGADLELVRMRLEAVGRLAQVRRSNSRWAFGAVVLVSVLAGLGLLLRLSYVPSHVALPALVAVGAIDGALALAVVALHRTTMRGLHDDLRLAFGEEAGRRERSDEGGLVTSRPVPQSGRRPLVVGSRVGAYPPLLRFLVAIGFLGFLSASVLAYATHSLLPFTITSIVVAGLFVISVLPAMMTAIWAGEGRQRTAQAILYRMLGGPSVPYEEITARPLSARAEERDGGI